MLSSSTSTDFTRQARCSSESTKLSKSLGINQMQIQCKFPGSSWRWGRSALCESVLLWLLALNTANRSQVPFYVFLFGPCAKQNGRINYWFYFGSPTSRYKLLLILRGHMSRLSQRGSLQSMT